jgi:sulfur carrier protein ThiS
MKTWYCEGCKETHTEGQTCVTGSKSKLIDLLNGNGTNKHCIVVKCEYEVYPEEWAQILFLIDNALTAYDNGKYSNVKAMLEDAI